VLEIDLDQRRVLTDRNRTVNFDRLLIASGADPRPVGAEGRDLENIFYMRTERQVRDMLAVLPGVKQALVLGGGLVGFKAAYGLLQRGVKVIMLIRSGRPLAMQADPAAGGMIRDELTARGLEVRVGVEVAAFEGRGRVEAALLSDGDRIPCQMAVVGKGVSPALGFVPRPRIKTDLGVLVDRNLQTSEPGVYAAGDVAQAWDLVHQAPRVNAIWPAAVEQGRAAGANMAGRPVSYRGALGRNVMRIFDLDLMTAGLVNPSDGEGCQALARHAPARRTYRKLVIKDGRLAGAVLVGDVEQGGVLIALIQRRTPLAIPPERLLEPSFNFATLLP
jgi:NAD(P)H-nitrite reductase large subunit